MKIAALSDMHGLLPDVKTIEKSELFIIAGDIFPTNIQHNISACREWYMSTFLDWVDLLPVKKVIVVGGNHDFFFEHFKSLAINSLHYARPEITKKIVYLQDESYDYNGLKIYGTPWCENLWRWAFFAADTLDKYKNIPKELDILITHQPPRIGDVGVSDIGTAFEENYGSQNLADVIDARRIKKVICGHVHSGVHGGINHGHTTIYNVSYVDEGYRAEYPITYFEI